MRPLFVPPLAPPAALDLHGAGAGAGTGEAVGGAAPGANKEVAGPPVEGVVMVEGGADFGALVPA